MHIDSKESIRARMLAEHTVARLNGKIRWKMTDGVRVGLTNALVKSNATEDLLFRNKPYVPKTPFWSVSGLLARVVLLCLTKLSSKQLNPARDEDRAVDLTQMHYKVQSSGAVGLLVALLIGLLVGITNLGMPAELGFQIGRDAVRRTAASGDIVVIAKDDRSAKVFGGLPWPRRYDAQLVDKLREMGAKRIVFNQVMADAFEPADDLALAAAFDRAAGKVWLGVSQERDSKTGKLEPLLPIPMFRERTHQAHFWLDFSALGHVGQISNSLKIGNAWYRSQSSILADINAGKGVLRPDYAVDSSSVKTISAVDIVMGNTGRRNIEGKTVFIATLSDNDGIWSYILGQRRAPVAYSHVIAAETLKNGLAHELGYLLPLISVGLIGAVCLTNRTPRYRLMIAVGCALALAAVALGGDLVGARFEMVPATLAFSIFAVREMGRRRVIKALELNSVSGLPNIVHLPMIKGHQDCAVVALKVDRYANRTAPLSVQEQRAVSLSIAARINIVAPDCLVHQGHDGLFVFVIRADSDIDIGTVGGQLTAIFSVGIVGLDAMHEFDVSVGIDADRERKFEMRREVAIDRAERGIYVSPRLVV